jgi:hypothetical protein
MQSSHASVCNDATTAAATDASRDIPFAVSPVDAGCVVQGIADARSSNHVRRVQAVTSHSAQYTHHWVYGPFSTKAETRACARLLVAAGGGPGRVPSCEHTLRYARVIVEKLVDDGSRSRYKLSRRSLRDIREFPQFTQGLIDYGPKSVVTRADGHGARVDYFFPVVVRALLLLGPGELPALGVGDADVFRIVLSMMNASDAGSGAPKSTVELALGALRAVEYASSGAPSYQERVFINALIERYAETLTSVAGCDHLDPQTLARCTRLESLTHADRFESAVWLGLSQLHTLHGVDLSKVSTAAIAAALPRLHTLTASCPTYGDVAHASVAGFFEDLLPRLRVFHFCGRWPAAGDDDMSTIAAPPLPLLQDLVWDALVPTTTLREFLRAQPTLLHIPYEFLCVDCPTTVDGGVLVDTTISGFLARVCEFHILSSSDSSTHSPLAPADVARILQAAPQLRTFRINGRVRFDTTTSWLTPTAAASDTLDAAAFEWPTHDRLRCFSLQLAGTAASCEPDAECAARLRRLHFPRLRELTVGDARYFVPPS